MKTTDQIGDEIIDLFIDNGVSTGDILETFARLTSSLIASAATELHPNSTTARVAFMGGVTGDFINLLKDNGLAIVDRIAEEEGIA